MNAQHSNRYTIGYDPVLTLAITNGIYKRRAKAESRARRIQAFKSIITRIITLNFRKP
jgi:transposase